MNALTVASKDQFFELLAEEFSRKLAKAEAKKISEFVKQHYAHIPLEELLERRLSDTYGAAMAAWQFMQKRGAEEADRKSTRLNSSHVRISYAVFCLKKKKQSTFP